MNYELHYTDCNCRALKKFDSLTEVFKYLKKIRLDKKQGSNNWVLFNNPGYNISKEQPISYWQDRYFREKCPKLEAPSYLKLT